MRRSSVASTTSLRSVRTTSSTSSQNSLTRFSTGSSAASTNSTRSVGNSTPDICSNCKRRHFAETLQGRYIHADLLDQYMLIRFTGCKIRRATRNFKHVVDVPEKLHEKEISYLQQATNRGKLVPGWIPPEVEVGKAENV